MYLLDTDHVTFLQRQDGQEWSRIVHHIERVGQEQVFLSITSIHEQMIGIHSKLNSVRVLTELPRWYRRLNELIDLFAQANVMLLDQASLSLLQILRTGATKVQLDPMDLRIASIALANDLTLITRNTSDFARVPNLKLEDWTK